MNRFRWIRFQPENGNKCFGQRVLLRETQYVASMVCKANGRLTNKFACAVVDADTLA